MITGELTLPAEWVSTGVRVGDEVNVTIRARCVKIEADMIDVSSFGPDGSDALPGDTAVTFMVFKTTIGDSR
jgi:hypothetical protein